jgi:hypothetical protein
MVVKGETFHLEKNMDLLTVAVMKCGGEWKSTATCGWVHVPFKIQKEAEMNMILAKMHGLLHGYFANGCCTLSDFKSCLSSHSLPQMATVITYFVS